MNNQQPLSDEQRTFFTLLVLWVITVLVVKAQAEQAKNAVVVRRDSWIMRICNACIRVGTERVPAELRDRLLEEWLAGLDEQDGILAKLRYAIGLVWAGGRIERQPVPQEQQLADLSLRQQLVQEQLRVSEEAMTASTQQLADMIERLRKGEEDKPKDENAHE